MTHKPNPITRRHNNIQAAIKERADQIREELKGCMLFGAPIDVDDVDQLVAAAYGLGKAGIYRRRAWERQALDAMEDR